MVGEHYPDTGDFGDFSWDHEILPQEESSARVMDLDLQLAEPTFQAPDASTKGNQVALSEVLEDTSINIPVNKISKVPTENPIPESLPIIAPIQPLLEISGPLAQLLSRAKLFTSGGVGSTRPSPLTLPSPLPSEQLH